MPHSMTKQGQGSIGFGSAHACIKELVQQVTCKVQASNEADNYEQIKLARHHSAGVALHNCNRVMLDQLRPWTSKPAKLEMSDTNAAVQWCLTPPLACRWVAFLGFCILFVLACCKPLLLLWLKAPCTSWVAHKSKLCPSSPAHPGLGLRVKP